CYFFFSSRRRHTRSKRDWSSDVCSSDLETISKSKVERVTEADNIRVLIAAGGTGGHVYPAIAIADAVIEQYSNVNIKFIGTAHRMEAEAVPAAGYDFETIWITGFHRRLTIKNLLFPIRLVVSLIQSLRIILKFNPHA